MNSGSMFASGCRKLPPVDPEVHHLPPQFKPASASPATRTDHEARQIAATPTASSCMKGFPTPWCIRSPPRCRRLGKAFRLTDSNRSVLSRRTVSDRAHCRNGQSIRRSLIAVALKVSHDVANPVQLRVLLVSPVTHERYGKAADFKWRLAAIKVEGG